MPYGAIHSRVFYLEPDIQWGKRTFVNRGDAAAKTRALGGLTTSMEEIHLMTNRTTSAPRCYWTVIEPDQGVYSKPVAI